MQITKRYLYTLKFDAGSDELSPDSMSLELPLLRAREIAEHRIRITSYEDESDPNDRGFAEKRNEFFRQKLQSESISLDRVEFQTGTKELPADVSPWLARRAEFEMYPRVASLNGDGTLLTPDEISTLETAREVALFPENEYTAGKREILEKYSKEDWMRIVGFQSFEAWKRAGARHPLYEISIFSPLFRRHWRKLLRYWLGSR